MNLIIGANGLVGSALMRYLSDSVGTYHTNKDNLCPDRKYEYLDVTDTKSIAEVFKKYKPNKVFLAGANPHVDACENTHTDEVNVDGLKQVVLVSAIYKSQLIFFSSSYVFDGKSQTAYKPTDETFPINRYGRQKEIIERCIQDLDELRYLIIRTVGVFGEEGKPKNFVSQIVKAVAENKKIYVPTDQTMNPVYAMDLAKVAIHLSDRYTNEIFHVAGDKCISKYDFAIKVAYKLGHTKPHDLIVGVKTEDMKQVALRPSNGCLDCRTLETRAMNVPSFEKGLSKFLES